MKNKQEEDRELLEPDKEKDIPADGNQVTSTVKIKAPRQKDGKDVRFSVRRNALDVMEVESTERFRPGRFVLKNFLLHKETEIDPPVVLKIEILDEDVRRAQGQSFRLAYTQGNRWVVWPEEFPCQPGFVSVSLTKREDPAIAISP